MGPIEDIAKLVDQIVEENLDHFLDAEDLPEVKPQKDIKLYKNNYKNNADEDLDWDLDTGDEKSWLEEFDSILKEAESVVEPKKSQNSGSIGVKGRLPIKTTALIVGGGLVILGLAAGVTTMVVKKRSVRVNTFTTLPVKIEPVNEITKPEKPKSKNSFKKRMILQPLF